MRQDYNSCQFTMLDRDFEQMMIRVERSTEQELIKHLLEILLKIGENYPSNFRKMIDVYDEFSHLWGGFDPETGNYDHFVFGIKAVYEHVDDIRCLYNNVEDYRSRKVIYGLIKFWLELDFDYKNIIKENNFDDYFDLDILDGKISEEEVFVDCGAYIGDTAEAYFRNFSQCRRMYLYDLIPANLRKAKMRLAEHEEIIYRNVGLGEPEQCGMKIKIKDEESSVFAITDHDMEKDQQKSVSEENDLEIEIVTLDSDIDERITFLKMDIEGSEINALMGAEEHIRNEHPKLAICAYHHYEHLWEIARLVRSFNADYKLYLRYNGAINGVMASEYVLFAI